MLPLSILRSAAHWTFWFVSLVGKHVQKTQRFWFWADCFIFTLLFVFCLHCFTFHETTVDKYTLFIGHEGKIKRTWWQFLIDSSTIVPMTIAQIGATLTSPSLTSLTGRDSRRCCWGLWLEWRRPEGNTTGKSGSPQVFLHTGIPWGA